MKMKQDPEAPDQKNAKQAASTWIQTASKSRKDSELEEEIAEKLQTTAAVITIEEETVGVFYIMYFIIKFYLIALLSTLALRILTRN